MEEQSKGAIDERQDERQEDRNEKYAEAQPRDVEKWEFALSVLKEAVTNAGIEDISEYKGEPLNLRWHVFSQESDGDVVLKLLVQGLFGAIHANVSLILTAKFIIDEVENVLNQPDATRVLDFKEEERSEVLRENARMILTGLVSQFPIVAFQILSQSLRDAVQAHVNNHVEPLLKEHWRSLGLPKNYTVSPSQKFNDEHQIIDEQFEVLRQSFLGNKRARLTPERRANLDDEHEQLRSEYQVAKDHYNRTRKVFFASQRSRTEDNWTEEWNTQSYRMFPTLHYRCLAEINSYPPYELAYIHLAESYGYSAEYIRKLVTKASSLKPSKP
ncbi:MAG: hypothetical protein M3430_17320 [Acidobacteriota bacterium]|nr:hypothetical protein [Acidobacteriota bacterium]